MNYLCSLKLAKRAWPELACHNLAFLAHSLGLELEHHNAASDAKAAAELVLLAAQKHQHSCPRTLAEILGVFIGEIFSHDEWMSCSSPRLSRIAKTREVELPHGYDITQHPFYGKNIVFSGTLSLFQRSDAQKIIKLFGGIKKVNFGIVARRIIDGGFYGFLINIRA